MNIVVPMAGLASRFQDKGYTTPKPFLPLGDRTMIEQVIDNISNPGDHVILLHRTEHLDLLESVKLRGLAPGRSITLISVDKTTEGQACTVLLAKSVINDETPLVIANSDQFVQYDRQEWLSFTKQVDGGLMVFHNTDPKWSYAKVDDYGRVVEVREKEVISDCATVGIYFFKHGHDFVREAEAMIARDERVRGEFYVAPTYNVLCKGNGVYPFWIKDMYGLGVPEDYETNRLEVEKLL